MTFLFWNCKNKNLESYVSALVEDHDAEVLVLAECASPKLVLQNLNKRRRAWVHARSRFRTKTRLFIRGARSFVVPLFDEAPRLSVYELRFPAKAPLLLATVHLASGLFYNENDQATEAMDLVGSIDQVERRVGHTRTIVIGDFNMTPFSLGLISARGFNAVMGRDIAALGGRRIAGTLSPFFYNPMWKLLGGPNNGLAGTFFAYPTGYESWYWHMWDQVLVRPRLLNYFVDDDVKIVTDTSIGPITGSNGRPNISDHFPISIKLKY